MNGSSPLVTVIIPAYNAAATLDETLCSVRDQTYRNLEILVVDDGSKDETVAIAERHVRADSRIQLIRQANSGVAAARNNALRQAKGDWVAPVDADDLWHPEKIARQVDVMLAASSRVALIYNWFAQIDAAGLILHYAAPNTDEGDVFHRMFDNGLIGNGSTPLMRRDVVLACGGYDSGLHAAGAQGCEDLHLYLAIAENHHYAVAPGYLTGYRITPGNMSSNGLRMIRSQRFVLDPIARRLPALRRNIDRAQFDFMAWYVLRCIGERHFGDALKVALMMLGRYPFLAIREGLFSKRSLFFRIGRKLTRMAGRKSMPAPEPGPVGVPFLAGKASVMTEAS